MDNIDRVGAIIICSLLLLLLFSQLSQNGKSNAPVDDVPTSLSHEIMNMPNSALTDEQLIVKTHDLPEVKFLIMKYPYASENVDIKREHQTSNEAGVLVIYSVEKNVINSNTSSEWRKLNLVISLPPNTNSTGSINVGCELSDPSILQTFSESAMDNLHRDICFQ